LFARPEAVTARGSHFRHTFSISFSVFHWSCCRRTMDAFAWKGGKTRNSCVPFKIVCVFFFASRAPYCKQFSNTISPLLWARFFRQTMRRLWHRRLRLNVLFPNPMSFCRHTAKSIDFPRLQRLYLFIYLRRHCLEADVSIHVGLNRGEYLP